MKKIIQSSLIGALIGLSASYIIITIVLLQNQTRVINGQELLLEFLLAVFLGVGCGLITLIFYFDRWPFVVKLSIHYVVVLILVLICGAIGDWYENPAENPVRFLMFIGVQLIIYILVWAVLYWLNLREMKKINEKLKRK
ncbi:DUF3021 domain-containing protein [Brevibacillus laterosporus]|uniref:DUF3021 domain-containing protein n=1 Tax=Brevibacillus laterosporus TaxID=1465 RepID=A0AAP3G709_BRELA|nr:DUF3021 domain-containing protein [Brevibacillus laterosporus]AYB41147.1 DUF3021 domain-containing protein [Brevibacillus laterosporus]MBG9797687.1 membrane protein [Brevibacillus laterosporus]MBM7110075.1 hypothetical protein [Brevibacillus laterosporus]MCR8940113.1 DUF3021 domain-containing protein [Brevibacillus laterosporus]MCR8978555.1 DUF3021 domain-containing protein [Brevibacillus laterosporus]